MYCDTDTCPKCCLNKWFQVGPDGLTLLERVLGVRFTDKMLKWFKVEIESKLVKDKNGKDVIHKVFPPPRKLLVFYF